MSGVGFDFGMLPPEVNSGLMYTGAGPQSLMAAAAAWADLARELESAADVCAGVVSRLAGNEWQGPAAASMAAAAIPYTSWLHTTAAHAAQAADHATAAVTAYENAFAATVPPAVVAANRAQLAALVATNVLGHNTAAIAATEAHYAEMWAQDAAAMYGYAAQSAAAARLTPLTTPPTVTTDTGPAHQAAATTHAAAAGTTPATLSQLLSSLPTTLSALATATTSTTGSTTSPLSALVNSLGLNIFSPGSGTSTTGLAGLINLVSGSVPNPVANVMNSSWFSNAIFAGYPFNPEYFLPSIGDLFALGTITGRSLSHLPAASGVGTLGPIASETGSFSPALGGPGALVGNPTADAEVSASVGKATLVGALSAPRSWTRAAPAAGIRLAAAVANPSASMPGVAIGPMGLPAMSMPGAARGNSLSAPQYGPAPRYGFRLTVLPPAPTGDSPVHNEGFSK
ncbi:PPE family protein [Mycobacterium botniense]|uniref:PPE family protein PPE15 n=1 Tax=Mycobacterium botniense TaxID=84962 RepID=A0A7I9XUY8_9MYCO|nr:PPE family protein [Mycobacterium botniense]GFG73350.1 PPE family protein PPE15 [Mycobacterium botniense]